MQPRTKAPPGYSAAEYVHFLYFHDDVIMTFHDHNKNQSSMGIKKKCHIRKIVILAIHGLLVMRWNWYIDTCHILLTCHGNYLEKLRKIVILVYCLYFHDDVIMTFHDHNKNQSSIGIKKKCHVRKNSHSCNSWAPRDAVELVY
jgi:hypothetical protein